MWDTINAQWVLALIITTTTSIIIISSHILFTSISSTYPLYSFFVFSSAQQRMVTPQCSTCTTQFMKPAEADKCHWVSISNSQDRKSDWSSLCQASSYGLRAYGCRQGSCHRKLFWNRRHSCQKSIPWMEKTVTSCQSQERSSMG
jgi:hypothetical protein